MSDIVSSVLGIQPPPDDVLDQDGKINMSAIGDWGTDALEDAEALFSGRTIGLHVGYAKTGTFGQNLGIQGGLELTGGFALNFYDPFLGPTVVQAQATASISGVAGIGGDSTAIYDLLGLGSSNEVVRETSLVFGEIEDIGGVSAGIEFTITINGATTGIGASVPLSEVDSVVSAINNEIIGRNFGASLDADALASILEGIFPDGSMVFLKAGHTRIKTSSVTLLGELSATGLGSDVAEATRNLWEDLQIENNCFVAGTNIDMWPADLSVNPHADVAYDEEWVLSKVWSKPIEEIRPNDLILSYNENGNLVPGRVTRTFQNEATHILDFWGTGVTPGHAYLCGDSAFKGQYVPIMDILRTDGAIVRSDGTLIRAATGCEVGSAGDRMLHTVVGPKLTNGRIDVTEAGQIRCGTRVIMDDGMDASVMDLILAKGGEITEDGYVPAKSDGQKVPFRWPFSDDLPKPEDYILKRSGVDLKAIYLAGEWEATGTRLAPPSEAIRRSSAAS